MRKLSYREESLAARLSKTKVVLIQKVPFFSPLNESFSSRYLSVGAHMPLVDLTVVANFGNISGLEIALPISCQFCKSLDAWIGIPGNALKLLEAQK